MLTQSFADHLLHDPVQGDRLVNGMVNATLVDATFVRHLWMTGLERLKG